jgi:hypothetical protein
VARKSIAVTMAVWQIFYKTPSGFVDFAVIRKITNEPEDVPDLGLV